jgi:hypothetical protein
VNAQFYFADVDLEVAAFVVVVRIHCLI